MSDKDTQQTTWDREDRKWALWFYGDLARDAKDLGRPDLAIRAIACAKAIRQEYKQSEEQD